ncbi:hypothetical protein [Halobacillus sp. KGW1]|uniref:hypothetical protein n=1 Tax=Halobacillus sp. KGW1 TaxID=1793726 RepID=UPI000783CEB3|nr:hypothetical protein [Halobacillus sp. KGW1]
MEKDTILLQQKIIHFKSELAKYKEKVKDYQENYHYALLEKLKKENTALRDREEQLQKEKSVATQESVKRIQGMEQQIASMEKAKQTMEEETALWKEKAARFQKDFESAQTRLIRLQKESSAYQYQLKQAEKHSEERESLWKEERSLLKDKLAAEKKAKDSLFQKAQGLREEAKDQREYVQEERQQKHNWKAVYLENRTRAAGLAQENAEIQKRLEAAEQEAAVWKDQAKQLETEVRKAEGELARTAGESAATVSEWKLRERQFQKDIIRLKQSAQEKQQLLNIREEEQERLETENKELCSDIKYYVYYTKQLGDLLSGAEVDLNKQRDVVRELEQSKIKAEDESRRIGRELETKVAALKQLEDEQHTRNQERRLWEEERQNYQSDVADLKGQLKEAHEQVEELQMIQTHLKKQNEKVLGMFSKEGSADTPSDILSVLDEQMKNILGQTFEYEEQLDSKIIFMEALEEKIDQLGKEILQMEGRDGQED